MGLIISGLVAAGSFLGLMHALVAIPLKSCIKVAPDISLVSNEIDLLIIFACLVIAWILGYLQKNNFSYNGIGTQLYGHETTEDGYITTKWLTCFFPLLPIRSYIVMDSVQEIYNLGEEAQHDFLHPIDTFLYLPQILQTGFISYMTLYWGWGSLWVMLNSSFCLK
jgi:hypothetical protein